MLSGKPGLVQLEASSQAYSALVGCGMFGTGVNERPNERRCDPAGRRARERMAPRREGGLVRIVET